MRCRPSISSSFRTQAASRLRLRLQASQTVEGKHMFRVNIGSPGFNGRAPATRPPEESPESAQSRQQYRAPASDAGPACEGTQPGVHNLHHDRQPNSPMPNTQSPRMPKPDRNQFQQQERNRREDHYAGAAQADPSWEARHQAHARAPMPVDIEQPAPGYPAPQQPPSYQALVPPPHAYLAPSPSPGPQTTPGAWVAPMEPTADESQRALMARLRPWMIPSAVIAGGSIIGIGGFLVWRKLTTPP